MTAHGDAAEESGPRQDGESRLERLANELIEASGNYGLRPEKLSRATALLGLRAVRERAEREGVSAAEAAVRIVMETVKAWPDMRGRLILANALGFDRGTERGRTNRLDLLAAQLREERTPDEVRADKDQLDGRLLDTTFVLRLVRDLAAALLASERSTEAGAKPSQRGGRQRRLLPSAVVAVVLLVGVVAYLLLRDDNTTDDATELVFRPVPERCLTDVCHDEASAVTAITEGFTPGGTVTVAIFAPSGQNANGLGGAYAYQDELVVNDEGGFVWRYWWDPGMEMGVYGVEITDEESDRRVETEFEFYTSGQNG